METILTVLICTIMFFVGVAVGFFLSFYVVLKKRIKEKVKRESSYNIQPKDVKDLYDI